jgi:hypothetical protein
LVDILFTMLRCGSSSGTERGRIGIAPDRHSRAPSRSFAEGTLFKFVRG